jgi:quercetin dioxygenase-like cupin family protein
VEGGDSPDWEWPDSLDALVAAPEFHSLILENDDVRVLETRIGPGETAPVHTHRWPCVLRTVATAHFVRRDGDGRVLTDTRAADPLPATGATAWLPPMPPHSVENVGSSEIHLLIVELKRSGRT